MSTTTTLPEARTQASAIGVPPTSPHETVADLLNALGGIGPERVRMTPWPGTATEADFNALDSKTARALELVDGVLVEKAMGFPESWLASLLIHALMSHIQSRNLGIVTSPDGAIRLSPGLVRAPDVAFYSWSRLPGGKVPTEGFPPVVPDLAVEILSPSNTTAEMDRKRAEYFAAGVRAVWIADPRAQTVTIHRPDGTSILLGMEDMITSEDILPGFSLAVRDWLSTRI